MASASYWQPDWFLTGWFPSVWFAPADESGVPEGELRPEYYGGGQAHRESPEERTRIIREHYDYLDALREIQVRVSDSARGDRTVSMRADMQVPEELLPPAMRGTVPPTRVADVLCDPLIMATMALLIDEADD